MQIINNLAASWPIGSLEAKFRCGSDLSAIFLYKSRGPLGDGRIPGIPGYNSGPLQVYPGSETLRGIPGVPLVHLQGLTTTTRSATSSSSIETN
eukprot:1227304-Rhodomonas_salina.1